VTVESLTTEDRIELGIIKRLPVSLHGTLLKMSDTALGVEHIIIGAQMRELYNEVKEIELKEMETWNEAKDCSLLRFTFNKYGREQLS
jgi:hypothetical protein